MNLIYKHEKSLFRISAVISILAWVALVVGTFGIALAYILFGYLFLIMAQSAFISYLKGTGVKISQEQFPDIHQRLVTCCNKVGLDEIPEAYILRTDFFNALATRFLGRHFVVLFSDVVDSLEDQPGAIDFYLGHELGHIHRKHLLWSPILMPASILPVIGAAMRRAEEYTCDRYGVACCQNEADIKAALAAIAAGDTRWKTINVDAYIGQVATTNGFWMSFNELTGDYPWLTKRMATALALSRGQEVEHPRRHMFAWFISLFIPRLGAGGVTSLVITIMMVAILAAIAIPAYHDYVQEARNMSAYTAAQDVQAQVSNFIVNKQEWPESLVDLGYDSETMVDPEGYYEIAIYDNGIVGAKIGVSESGEGSYIVLEPTVTEGELNWSCYGQNALEKQLPPECR
jgi:Zn-dependent protease with chaperone function/competence protein ComGC